MREQSVFGRVATVVATLATLTTAQVLCAGVVEPELRAALDAAAPGTELRVIASFTNPVDLAGLRVASRADAAGRARLVEALRARNEAMTAAASSLLQTARARKVVPLWLVNGLAFTASPVAITRLAALPTVASVRLDATLVAPQAQAAATASPEWNIQMVHAPELWAMGYAGAGVVVAEMDTGVDVDHPDLAASYRGGSNSWFDPNGQHQTPSDASGHGTQTMGVIVGGSAGGSAIGMAPAARWIAVKIFNDSGTASLSAVHAGFQWLLDPDGNPDTNDAPDIVNGSWGYPSRLNQCYQEFAPDIVALRAAEISVVMAAGNSGPTTPSSMSPADNPGALSVGAVDSMSTVASFSGRGPAACDGSVYPDLAAPGVGIRTADLTFGGVVPDSYATVTGTSIAAAHVTGALALLLSASPSANVATLESVLADSAVDLGFAGADNSYGYGLIDVMAASGGLGSGAGGVTAAGDSYGTVEDTPLAVATPGVLANDSGATLTAVLVTSVSHGTLSLGADGAFGYSPDANFAGTDSFTYEANDGSTTSAPATVTISVSPVNDPPVASGDAWNATAGSARTVAAPGVLANDTDVDGDVLQAVLATGPAHASAFALAADGSFSYTAVASYVGTDSFTYKASDGQAASVVATVSLTVSAPTNQAPVAVADSAVTRRGTAVAIKVLANDYDPDGSLVAGSVTIVVKPLSGSVGVARNGTVKYTPKKGFSGTDTFTYTVKDNLGAVSNAATVKVTVR